MQQQVVEVEQGNSIATGLERLVGRVHRGNLCGVQRNITGRGRDRVGILLGRDQRGLGPLDLTGHVADVVGAELQAGAGGPTCDDGELGLQQLPTGVADDPRPEIPQLPVRGGVKCHRLHRTDAGLRVGSQCPQPGPHFAGRTLGEGHRQDLTRGDVSGRDELGDAVGDRPGLTGPRAGQNADRPAGSQHGLALFVIEVGNQGVRDHRHGVHLGSDGRQTSGSATPRHTGGAIYVCRTMSNASITMYSTQWCGYCHRLKTALKSAGIAYDEVDIEQDPTAAEFVGSVNGGNHVVPTLKFADGSTLTNPGAKEVKAKLAKLAG